MLNYLRNLNWPGNLRELSNGIARYVLLGPEAAIAPESSKPRKAATQIAHDETHVIPLKRIAKDAIRELERSAILEALQANQWNRRETAKSLKISYRALIYKIRNAGLISGRSRLASTPRDETFVASQSSTD
jgi:DNA-binding NtrC family response regulator